MFLAVLALGSLFLAGMVLRDRQAAVAANRARLDSIRLAEALRLTDLAIWTEARYTRHPSQADYFAAFQNGPAALDQFPAGTWFSMSQYRRQLVAAPGGRAK